MAHLAHIANSDFQHILSVISNDMRGQKEMRRIKKQNKVKPNRNNSNNKRGTKKAVLMRNIPLSQHTLKEGMNRSIAGVFL